MPVDSTHPDYDLAAPFWMKLRDGIGGEDRIRSKESRYLPIPSGMLPKGPDGLPRRDLRSVEKDQPYQNYLHRARYPEALAPAVEAMVGLMSRKPPEIEMPEALEYLQEEATPDGLPLDSLVHRVRHEVVSLGRYVLFVDVPEEGGEPFIATYPAESLINWRGDADRLTLAVFEEEVGEPKLDDPFVEERVPQWRVAAVEADESGRERYVVRIFRKITDNQGRTQFILVDETFPTRQGEPLDFVPAVIVGSRDLLPTPDAIPLLGAANKALHFYRQYADYAYQLFWAAHGTTPFIAGVDPEDKDMPSEVGPSTIWAFSNPDTKVGYIEISGTGLDAQKAELDNIATDLAAATLKVLGSERRQAEAAEALRLRFQSQTATLASIAETTAAGLERALRFVAEWAGADPESVTVTPSLEFIREIPDANVLNAIMSGVDRGQIPIDDLFNYMSRTELTGMDRDTFLAMTPAAQALPPNDEI